MSKNKNKNKHKEIETTENVEVETLEPVVEEVVKDEIEISEAPKLPREGKVSNCTLLNVREIASRTSDVIAIIPDGEIVGLFTEEEETEDFYKVMTNLGIIGYCMKRFITVVK